MRVLFLFSFNDSGVYACCVTQDNQDNPLVFLTQVLVTDEYSNFYLFKNKKIEFLNFFLLSRPTQTS